MTSDHDSEGMEARAVMVVTAESLESRDRGCTGQGPL